GRRPRVTRGARLQTQDRLPLGGPGTCRSVRQRRGRRRGHRDQPWIRAEVTMSLLGRAIARWARKIGGQLMLELPDDLDPPFIGEILFGANAEVAVEPEYALFVRGQRQDAGGIQPQVDFRELAMYRQGSHLA